MEVVEIFCEIDDFCKQFEKDFALRALSAGNDQRDRAFSLTLGEVVTIPVLFHMSGYRTFKDFYTKCSLLPYYFPKMTSYNRFTELQKKAIVPMMIFMELHKMPCDGLSFVDSFALRVSHEKRIYSHKTFKGCAQKGKTSMGWFYGFKLHLVINVLGEIVEFAITTGNVADNNSEVLDHLTKNLHGKVFGDKGYLTNPEKFEEIYKKGVHIVTKIRKNMKNKLMDMTDKLLLRKRGVIESVGNIFKRSFHLEHARYRNPTTFLVNVFSCLIAYLFRNDKPSIYRKRSKNRKPARIQVA